MALADTACDNHHIGRVSIYSGQSESENCVCAETEAHIRWASPATHENERSTRQPKQHVEDLKLIS